MSGTGIGSPGPGHGLTSSARGQRVHQGRGLGSHLMTATMDYAQGLQPRPARMRLSVLPANLHAQRLYERFGFAGDDIEDGERVMWCDL